MVVCCYVLVLSAMQLIARWERSALGLLQVRGRTKSLFSTMKKLLRLDDMAKGGRGRDEIYDLLGMRVVVAPLPGTPVETTAIAATQASLVHDAGTVLTSPQSPPPIGCCWCCWWCRRSMVGYTRQAASTDAVCMSLMLRALTYLELKPSI